MRMRIRSHEQPRTSTHEELPAGRSDESSDAGAHAMRERERNARREIVARCCKGVERRRLHANVVCDRERKRESESESGRRKKGVMPRNVLREEILEYCIRC